MERYDPTPKAHATGNSSQRWPVLTNKSCSSFFFTSNKSCSSSSNLKLPNSFLVYAIVHSCAYGPMGSSSRYEDNGVWKLISAIRSIDPQFSKRKTKHSFKFQTNKRLPNSPKVSL